MSAWAIAGIGCGVLLLLALCAGVAVGAFVIVGQTAATPTPKPATGLLATPTGAAVQPTVPAVATVPTLPTVPPGATVAPAKPTAAATATPTRSPTPGPTATPDRRRTPVAGTLPPVVPSPSHANRVDVQWPTTLTGMTSSAVPNGIRLETQRADDIYFVRASTRVLGDVTVEASMRQDAGAPRGDYGFILRTVDRNNLIVFAVTGDGSEYGVYQRRNGEWNRIATGRALPAGLARRAPEFNRLRAVLVGAQISVYLNDQFLETVRLEGTQPGEVGVEIEPAGGTNSTVTVTDFRILIP